jgi:nitroreductase/Pyruvate/2-oxoacid:ferredoxin oxidoreductase delta subunit
MTHTINKSTCKECDLCITICPSGILSRDSTGATVFLPERTSICVKCGHCMAVCSKHSISIEGISYEVNLPPLPPNHIQYDDFMKFLMTRRSVRHFLDRPVPREVLEKIVDAISLAPFGVAPDNVEITVVANRNLIRKAMPAISQMYLQLGKILKFAPMQWLFRRMMPQDAANTLLNFLLPHLNKGLYDFRKEDDISRNAPAMILFHAAKGAEERTPDAMIYTTYAFLAAHSLGLGATVIGLIGPGINRSKKLKALYQIPPGNEVIQTLILGYPKINFKRAIVRPRTKVKILERNT